MDDEAVWERLSTPSKAAGGLTDTGNSNGVSSISSPSGSKLSFTFKSFRHPLCRWDILDK